MEARTIATQVAYSRIAIGALLMAAPRLVARGWVGGVADRPGSRVMATALGARDLAIGAGTVSALRSGGPARPWLLAAAFSDAIDCVTTFAARRSLPSLGAPGTVALAATGLALGLWTARELE